MAESDAGVGVADHRRSLTRDFIAVASVAVSILIMVCKSTEHPPAAGTVLGLVAEGWTTSAVLFVVLVALMLSAVYMLLRRRLVNLF